MPTIELPDGTHLDVTPPTQAEQDIIELLKVVARMLDLLVRLECNALKRADLKRDILETEAAIKAFKEEQENPKVPTAEAAVDAAYPGRDPEQDNLPETLTAE
jgi:hypothetical protein